MARIRIFLIAIALIAGMVGCDDVSPKYDLTMEANPAAGGTATDETSGSPYEEGTEVSIKAVASTGYQFVNWTAPAGTFADSNAEETDFTMPAQDVIVTANFVVEIVEIRNWNELDAIRDNLDGNYILMNDLNSTTAGYNTLVHPDGTVGEGWEPIGTEEYPFMGSFDGQGYEIRDLFIDRPVEDYVGLFGFVDEGGRIQDIGVTNVTMNGHFYVGGLVGMNHGTVNNSYSAGNVQGFRDIGGLVGQNSGNMVNSSSTASVTSTSSPAGYPAGGLAGENDGTVINSYSTGDVTGDSYIGGLVGLNHGTVNNSYSTGNVTGDDYSIGGLVGCISHISTVSNSYATGSVFGKEKVGGLVGMSSNGAVSNSYATGSVFGNEWVGGLVGLNNNSTVSNSYSTGNVHGTADVGGLVGQSNNSTVTHSFWDTETSGQATSDGGIGKTTTEMQDITTFSSAMWDIVAVANPGIRNPAYIWNIVNNVTYPFLSWEPVS